MTTVDDVEAALKELAVAARTLSASETKSQLLRLLDGYFQASVALAGPPMMGGGGVVTLAQGLHVSEIARHMDVPLRRIYWVRQKLRRRFGVQTNEHLISMAIQEGFAFPSN